MILAAVFTCGRLEYLEATMASFAEQVTGPVTRTVIFDDSGDPEIRAALRDTYESPVCSVVDWGRNRGFTGAVHRAWMWIDRHAVEPYVFHLEEDFTFDRPVDLGDLVEVLDAGEHLDQVALLRHPFFKGEVAAGGIIERDPGAHRRTVIAGHDVVEHRQVFTTNPSLYRRQLCSVGWPLEDRSERAFTRRRVSEDRVFAYLGDGTPQVTHIGENRTMNGY